MAELRNYKIMALTPPILTPKISMIYQISVCCRVCDMLVVLIQLLISDGTNKTNVCIHVGPS